MDVLEVAGQAGHKDPSVTLRTYAHRMPSGRDRVRKIQSAAWAAGTQPTVIPLRPDDEAAA